MRQIETIQIWKNGESQAANILNAYIINDNLETSCTFYYQLCGGGQGTEQMPLFYGTTLADGNVTMQGEKYLQWDGSNDYAFTYIAEQLNLTITGDCVPPVPPQPEPTPAAEPEVAEPEVDAE